MYIKIYDTCNCVKYSFAHVEAYEYVNINLKYGINALCSIYTANKYTESKLKKCIYKINH